MPSQAGALLSSEVSATESQPTTKPMKNRKTNIWGLIGSSSPWLGACTIAVYFLTAGQSMAQSTWTGGTSTAWGDSGNWLDTATLLVPGIPAGSTTLTFGGTTYGEPANLPANKDITPFITGAINLTNNGTAGQTAGFTLGTASQSITLGGNINTTAISAGGAAISDVINLDLILNNNRTIGTNGVGGGSSHNVTVNGNISETGGARILTKGGSFPSGTLTLAGNNTYTGFTVIETGTVTVSKIADSGDSNLGYGTQITMSFGGTGATLNYNGSGSTTSRKVQLGSSNAGQLGGTAGGTITASGSNGGTGLVFTAPTFIQTVSSTTASRTLTLQGANTDANQIQGAIVDVETEVLPAVTTATNITKTNGGLWILAPSSPSTYTGSTTVSDGTLAGIGANAFGSTSGISIGASGILSLRADASTNFVKTSDSSLYNVTASASGATINVNQATIAGTGAKTMSIGNLGSSSTANVYQLNFTGANNTSLNLGAVTGAANNSSTTPGTVTINNNIASTGTLTLASYTSANAGTLAGAGETVTFGGAGNTIVSGAITPSANPLSLTKSGSGTVRLDGSSAYTGTTTVSGGVLQLNNAAALPAGGILNLTGGVLGLGTGDFTRALGAAGGEVSIGGNGGFAAYGTDRIVNIGGSGAVVNWNGTAPSISGNTLVLGSSTATHTVTFENPLAVSGGRFLQTNDGAAAVDGIFAGNITGTGFVSKTGAGTLQLNGTGNSWTVGTFIDSGTLRLGAAGVLPDGQGLTVKRASNAASTNGVLDLAGNNETIGNLTLGSPSGEGNALSAGQTPSVVNTGAAVALTTADITYDAGNASFLNGQATISANIITNTGGNRNITVGDGAAAEDLVISGKLSGTTNFISKVGNGTLVLSGTNDYVTNAATNINTGTLLINGDSSAVTGQFNVNNTTTLGGNGIIGGNATVGADASLSPGATGAVGTLTILKSLNISAQAGGTGKLIYALDTIASSDKIALVTGATRTLSIGTDVLGFSDFTFSALPGLQNGTYKLITGATSIVGSLDPTPGSLTGIIGASSAQGTLQLNGGDLELVVTGAASSDPFEDWAGSGVNFDDDANNDGVKNGLAWLLGAGGPNANATGLLPKSEKVAGGLKLNFKMLPAAERDGAELYLEYSPDLGTWSAGEIVPDVDELTVPVTFDISGTDPLDVEVIVSDTEAAAGKLFGRLKAVR